VCKTENLVSSGKTERATQVRRKRQQGKTGLKGIDEKTPPEIEDHNIGLRGDGHKVGGGDMLNNGDGGPLP